MSDLYELVYVENTGDEDLSFPIPGYKRQVIKPGDKALIKFEIAATTFGHPSAKDSDRERARTEMLRNLKTYWGWHEGFDTDTADMQRHRDDHGWTSWEEKCPKFRVTTLNGDWIPMVLDDPDGVEPLPQEDGSLDAPTARASGNPAIMDRTLAAMQKQLADQSALIDRLLARPEASNGGVALSDLPPLDDEDGVDFPRGTKPQIGDTKPAPTSSSPSATELPKVPENEPAPTTDRPRGARTRPS